MLVRTDADFLQHIIYLVDGGAHFHQGVHQSGGANHLLDDLPSVGFFVVGRRGGHKNALAHFGFKLFELEGPVVQGAGQAKAVFNQGGLARSVTVVHGIELTDHLVTFVQEYHRVSWQIIRQGAGRSAWGGP